MHESCTVADLIEDATRLLEGKAPGEGDSAKLDVQILLTHTLGCNKAWLITHADDELDEETVHIFKALVDRRCNGEPVAYLTGRQGFWDQDLKVTTDTLIPRPETELLVETLLARFDDTQLKVADLGTGTGAIAIALAASRPSWQITAIERSQAALDVARQNATGHSNITMTQGSWCEPLEPSSLNIIVSNPPYIREGDPHLAALTHEPASALVAGPSGLECIEVIVRDAVNCLVPGGALYLEHGYDQGEDVRDLFARAGYADIETLLDLNGQARITMGTTSQ